MENNIIKNAKTEFIFKTKIPLPSKINFLLGGEQKEQEEFLQKLIKHTPENEASLKLTLEMLKFSSKLKMPISISSLDSPKNSAITIEIVFDNSKALNEFCKEFNL